MILTFRGQRRAVTTHVHPVTPKGRPKESRRYGVGAGGNLRHLVVVPQPVHCPNPG